MDDEALLAVIYRGRPATLSELATLSHLGAAEARRAVDGLRARGLLGGEGDDLAYPNPASWAAQALAQRAAELQRTSREALSALEEIAGELPEMVRHWSVGETSTDTVPVVVRHGTHASEDLWFDTVDHHGGALYAVLPEIDRFLVPSQERAERFGRALSTKDAVRVIMPTWAVGDTAAQRRMEHYAAAGVDFRVLDAPSSWFWVDGDHLAVPLAWGEGRPSSVIGVRSSSLAGMAREYFEGLWRAAGPAVPAVHSWTPLLTLMRQGMTLETASRRVGVNPRTGRRRIAAAMAHYGVSTLFALGVAWAADRSPPGSRSRT